MNPIDELMEVYVGEEGEICIAQRDMNEDCFVSFMPEQIDEFIALLREKQKEAFEFRARQPAQP